MSATQLRASSTYTYLARTLPTRRPPPIYSDLTPGNSHALGVSLSSFLPRTWTAFGAGAGAGTGTGMDASLPVPHSSDSLLLPPAHHLVYFNPVIPASQLLPDGTDPLQSPGAPFVRRMWAGGYVRFFVAGEDVEEDGRSDPVVLDGRRWVCIEGIRDVAVKGREGEEKVFVGIERRVGRARERDGEQSDRQRLWTEREDDWGDARLVERRNIVFMRERKSEEAKREVERTRRKMLFAQSASDFSHTLVPTPSLLFRYSALTFNAHAIHLDQHYSRITEGHRNLLVHGPLSLTLLVTLLLNNLPSSQRIAQIEYRNLTPLYCDEPIKLCGRRAGWSSRRKRDEKYEVWAETPEGGVAVKAIAHTAPGDGGGERKLRIG